jgi:hypothetical protein
MTATHTPGPWSVVRQGRVFHVNAARPFDEAEVEADARLIGASPLLLAALERAFEFLSTNFDDTDMADILGPCREALEAARGEVNATRAREPSRWLCPKCLSDRVQIGLPAWFTESADLNLRYVEVDAEAEIMWWNCLDCDETDGGRPTEAQP